MASRPATVGTTATQLAGVNRARRTISVTNNGVNRIFVSQDQSNIIANGFPVLVNQAITFLAGIGDEPWLPLYAQVASGSENVRVLEQFGLLSPEWEAQFNRMWPEG